ncbi:MAG: hypothetical protein OER12_06040 [Acidimicrobiia bacterium]|nr:hypothetical protein [Acidimicrobiia bacterium]
MSRNTDELRIEDAESLLSAAGISASLVDSCSDPSCRWCDPQPMQLAA